MTVLYVLYSLESGPGGHEHTREQRLMDSRRDTRQEDVEGSPTPNRTSQNLQRILRQPPHSAAASRPQRTPRTRSSKHGTYKTVVARLWPWCHLKVVKLVPLTLGRSPGEGGVWHAHAKAAVEALTGQQLSVRRKRHGHHPAYVPDQPPVHLPIQRTSSGFLE